MVQQVENNLLVPRIVGGALDLHPVLVIVGVFMGAALAGVLGAIPAAHRGLAESCGPVYLAQIIRSATVPSRRRGRKKPPEDLPLP